MVSLGRHLTQRAQGTARVKGDPAAVLIAHARHALERFPRFYAAYHLEHRVLALPDHDGIDKVGREGLIGQQRRVPAAEDNRQLREESLDLAADFDRFPDHRTGDQRNR